MRVLKGKLLSQATTPRDTKHIYLFVAKMIEHQRYPIRKGRKTVRYDRYRRSTGAWHIKTNDFNAWIEFVNERLEYFETDANAIQEQQRRIVGVSVVSRPDGDAQALTFDIDSAYSIWTSC